MPLSKEFYLDEIKSKYPNSYNESLKDLPIKDLEDMLDFLEGALSKADGGSIGIEVLFGPKRGEYQTGGQAYDSRATAQDYANALKSVSAGTTYQQQADAKRYATQEANRMLTDAFRSGNINQLANQFNFQNDPSLRFEKNRSGIYGLTQANRENVLKNMANQMLSTTTFGGGSSAPDPFQKKREELEKIKTENKRIFDEYIKNNPPQLGIITTPGQTPKPPAPPPYQDQKLLDQLTKLTPLQASYFDPFDQLSDIDQYNLSLAFPELKSQLRNPNQPRLAVMPDPQELFSRRYGIKDGGRVGLFMGGPALEGQALSIYNSMSAYGFSDQEIADALAERGLYTPGGTTEETGIIASAPNIINQQTGGDGPSTPPGPTYSRDDDLGTSDYQGTGPGFIESILGIPAALVNAYTKISPGINFVKSIFKPNVETYYKGPTIDAIAKAEEERKAKAAAERAAFLAEQQRTNIASQLGGPDGTSGGKYQGGAAFASANPYGGSGTMDDLGADSFYKDGGIVTMFKRKR